MNGLEERYASTVLHPMRMAGELVDWKFEAMGFRLGEKCFFYPDFWVVYPDRFEIHECKGRWEDDALVKMRVAAELYPWLKWKAFSYRKTTGWTEREF
jgi:hypothetical protein